MARYFFHLDDQGQADADHQGRDLPDLAAAISTATQEIRDFLADQVRHGYLDLNLRVNITDDSGQTVATVCCGDAVRMRD